MAFPSTGMSMKEATRAVQSFLVEDLDPDRNLATFSTTTFNELPIDILRDTLRKNLSNQHEYSGIYRIHQRCADILAALWHGGSDTETPMGTATTGSSEAVMLGCLALKKKWMSKRQNMGMDTSNPNIVFSSIAHIVCAKFAQYFDVEARVVSVTPVSGYVMDPEAAVKIVDQNTIGIIAVLGSTYTGHYEPVQKLSEVLDDLYSRTGIDIPIHVDAASGGLVAPFAQPELIWDFRLNRVHSINVSSHKFGQVPTSLGWVIWRDATCIPQDLIFDVEYLDQAYQTMTLSFSKPTFQVVLQYYNFIRNGFDGTVGLIRECMLRAQRLSLMLEKTGIFQCVSNIHYHEEQSQEKCSKRYSSSDSATTEDSVTIRSGTNIVNKCNDKYGLPVVAFAFSNGFQKSNPKARLETLSGQLRRLRYSVPYCNVPLLSGSMSMLRVVVRPGIDECIIERLVRDIEDCIRHQFTLNVNGHST